jgi:hypothetical protein
LSNLNRPDLPDDEEENLEESAAPRDSPQLKPRQNKTINNRAVVQSKAIPSRPSPGRTSKNTNSANDLAQRQQDLSTSRPYVAKSTAGTVFTQEETDLLMEAYDVILDVADDQIIDAWTAWAVEVSYPRITYPVYPAQLTSIASKPYCSGVEELF